MPKSGAEPCPRGLDSPAQAGRGKTTVLAAWAAGARHGQVGWLSLDSGDNDPVVFWTYFISALGAIRPGAGRAALSLLQRPGASLRGQVLPQLVNEMTQLPGRAHIVVDDYHLIVNRDIQEGVGFLVQHLPPSVHLLMASRTPPPLPLAQLRLRGELAEIGDDDLRFTEPEAGELLNRVLQLSLRP